MRARDPDSVLRPLLRRDAAEERKHKRGHTSRNRACCKPWWTAPTAAALQEGPTPTIRDADDTRLQRFEIGQTQEDRLPCNVVTNGSSTEKANWQVVHVKVHDVKRLHACELGSRSSTWRDWVANSGIKVQSLRNITSSLAVLQFRLRTRSHRGQARPVPRSGTKPPVRFLHRALVAPLHSGAIPAMRTIGRFPPRRPPGPR